MKYLIFILTILLSCNFAFAQSATENGELPLYHDRPGDLQAMISNLFFPYANRGARRNHRRYAGDAMNVLTTGVTLGNTLMGPCLAPPPGNPIACGMAMAAFNEAGISGESSGQSDDQQLRLATDGLSDTDRAALAASMAQANARMASLSTAGFSISADGQTVTTPPPASLTLNFADLGSDDALLAAGFTQAQIDQVKSTLDGILAANQATAVANAGNVTPPINGSTGRFIVPNPNQVAGGSSGSSAGGSQQQGRTEQGRLTGGNGVTIDRSPSSDLNFNKLSVNFNGTPIGVANGSLFNNVSATYQNVGLE